MSFQKSKRLPLVIMLLLIAICLQGCRDVLQGCGRCKNGVCNDGVCQCEADWYGEDCDLLAQQYYAGTYSITDNCISGMAYDITITAHPTEKTQVIITNIHNLGEEALAIYDLNGYSYFEMPHQTIGGKTYSGHFDIDESGNVISLNYTISSLPTPCAGTMIRK